MHGQTAPSVTETQTIELKAAVQGCPIRLFDTLSSFSNQDEGGIIIFGVDEAVNSVKKEERQLFDTMLAGGFNEDLLTLANPALK